MEKLTIAAGTVSAKRHLFYIKPAFLSLPGMDARVGHPTDCIFCWAAYTRAPVAGTMWADGLFYVKCRALCVGSRV